jgi:hypothetical protein
MRPGIDPNLITQLQAGTVGLAFLFEGHFINVSIYLWTGLGELSWNGQIWQGAGVLMGIGQAKETEDLSAQGMIVSLSGIDETLISLALQQLRQGQACTVYIACVDWTTNALQSTPYAFFTGRVDVPTIDDSATTATISLQLENRLVDFERERVRFFDPLTQNIYYPGDRGFDYVSSLQDEKIFWGISN